MFRNTAQIQLYYLLFQSFEVHLNGVHHCSVRYRQLHSLHQQLKKELQPATFNIPTFPPKKMLILSQVQVEERRYGLERYLQLISQDTRLSQSLAFNGFYSKNLSAVIF